MNYLPRTAIKRLAATHGYSGPHLTDHDLTEIRLAAVAAIKEPEESLGGYSYAIDVKGSGGGIPRTPSAEGIQACERVAYIALQCVHGNQTAKQVRCRACEGCRLNWLGRVRRLVLDGAQGWPTWMWTLTLKEYPSEMKGDRFDFAQQRWAKFRRKAYKAQVQMRYMRVVELQKRGTPHFHLAINRVSRKDNYISNTAELRHLLSRLAASAGFGAQTNLQKARLGAAGVASYLADYLKKSEDYYLMRREDGRAIRRYNHSFDWGTPLAPPTWRYTAVPDGFSHDTQTVLEVPCRCKEGFTLHRPTQARRWLHATREKGYWMAPLSVADYFLAGGP